MVREELIQFAELALANVGEETGEIALGIQALPLGAGDERVQPGVARCGLVVAGKQPVFSPNGHAFEGSLGGVVVDVQKACPFRQPRLHSGLADCETGLGARIGSSLAASVFQRSGRN